MSKEMKFEEAIASLEDIVNSLESGELSLEDAISSYEKAVGLVKICNEKLEAAQSRVKVITESRDGTVTLSDFLGNAN